MIRQAQVAFAWDGIFRSGNASLSHDLLSFVLQQLVPNGQPMLIIFGALAGWGPIFVDFVLKSY